MALHVSNSDLSERDAPAGEQLAPRQRVTLVGIVLETELRQWGSYTLLRRPLGDRT